MEGKVISGILVLVVLLSASVIWLWYTEKDQLPLRAEFTELAQCLERNGAQFYGAFWCGHCAQQKAVFDTAAKKLPYIECSTPDRNDQIPLCKDEEILAYPTWRFESGKECTGVVEPEVLAYLAQCSLPRQDGEEVTVAGLYERLIGSGVEEELRQAEVEEGSEEWNERIEESRSGISGQLEERYGTTLEETTDVQQFMAFYTDTYGRCQDREETPEEEEVPEQS